jgi:adenine-specific DNA-methyltransferase
VTRYSRKPRKEMEVLSEQIDSRYLLGILNSKYINWLLKGITGNGLSHYPEHLRNLPIPALDLSKNADKDRQDKLVAMVEEMLVLKDRETSEVLPQARTIIQRQIAGLDKRIDEAVYGLYGLTDEEIAAIELPLAAEGREK